MTEEELKAGSSLPYNLLLKKYVLAHRIFCMGPGQGNAVILASPDLTTSGHFKKKKNAIVWAEYILSVDNLK